MTEPTREEIQTAYNALETLTNTCTHSIDLAEELQELVLRVLPPKPKLTMGDIEWDDDKHYMAEAEHHLYGLVTMIGRVGIHGYIQCAFRNDDGINTVLVNRDYLTPTGRRYTLTEVQE